MENPETYKVLSCILEILKMMIESGAEIYRVEESAIRMFKARGAKKVDVYATTSNIIVSIETSDGVIKTHTRRIGSITTDIERIHKLNALARDISSGQLTLYQIKQRIHTIQVAPTYSRFVTILFYGVIAGAFYLFFNGRNWVEFLCSFGIGLVTGVLSKAADHIRINKFWIKFICSFIACMIAFSLRRFGVIESIDYIIIANIMTLIPGIGLTNSLRDLFVGDSISGILRLIEAMMLALAIACGYIITSFVFGGVM
ncbi:MAG: threonine/serine exporter family protein [Clostridia bacterium]|nr:threonine/serine exporter family protein [Clostridia bacterium]